MKRCCELQVYVESVDLWNAKNKTKQKEAIKKTVIGLHLNEKKEANEENFVSMNRIEHNQ